jgi:hypothetical protein
VDQLTGFPEICYGRYTIETHPNAFMCFCAVDMGECSRVTYPAAYVEFELMGLFVLSNRLIKILHLLRFTN